MTNENLELQKKIKEGINLIENNKFLEAEKIFYKLLENNETKTTALGKGNALNNPSSGLS